MTASPCHPGLRGRGALCGSFWKHRPIPRHPRMGQWASMGPPIWRRGWWAQRTVATTMLRSSVSWCLGLGAGLSSSKSRGDRHVGKKKSQCLLLLLLNPRLEGCGSQSEALSPPGDMSGDIFRVTAGQRRECQWHLIGEGMPLNALQCSGLPPWTLAPAGTPGFRQAAKGVTQVDS